jgi:hypothetical protein
MRYRPLKWAYWDTLIKKIWKKIIQKGTYDLEFEVEPKKIKFIILEFELSLLVQDFG